MSIIGDADLLSFLCWACIIYIPCILYDVDDVTPFRAYSNICYDDGWLYAMVSAALS